MDTPWRVTPDEVSLHFKVDPHSGLSLDQVRLHSERYGTNGACELPRITPLAVLTRAFNERASGRTRNTHLGVNP
jgi:Cation transporter/ATPase, N-terminus